MKKEEIAFMLKNGFTVNEVMAMCGEPEPEPEPEPEQKEEKIEPEQKQDEKTEPEQKEDEETETELVKTLKAELAKMREERQKQNRKDKIINTLPDNEKTEEEKVNEAILKIYEDSLK